MQIAMSLGVSDMVIGLTVVALGTSLPELASSIISMKKGEHDIAFGNVLGSNLFNTLAVVGIAGVIHPFEIPAEALFRDTVVMTGFTISLFIIGFSFRGRPGRINRIEGAYPVIGLHRLYDLSGPSGTENVRVNVFECSDIKASWLISLFSKKVFLI